MLKLTMALLLTAVWCSAGNITYNLDLPIGAGGVSGTITTDGAIGTLNEGNIVTWNLMLNDGLDVATLTPLNSNEFVSPGDALSATATKLSFNFADLETNQFLFQTNGLPGTLSGVCWNISPASCLADGNTGTGLSVIVGGDIDRLQFANGNLIGSSTGSSITPEPSTLALLGLGMAALGFCKFRVSRSS